MKYILPCPSQHEICFLLPAFLESPAGKKADPMYWKGSIECTLFNMSYLFGLVCPGRQSKHRLQPSIGLLIWLTTNGAPYTAIKSYESYTVTQLHPKDSRAPNSSAKPSFLRTASAASRDYQSGQGGAGRCCPAGGLWEMRSKKLGPCDGFIPAIVPSHAVPSRSHSPLQCQSFPGWYFSDQVFQI